MSGIHPGVYRHAKSRGLYRVLHLAIESTNARVGRVVVVYVSLSDHGTIHVRDEDEFDGVDDHGNRRFHWVSK